MRVFKPVLRLSSTLDDASERLGALFALVVVAMVAGLFLGHSTDKLEELPGLLLMVPAAIALRGNIFGAMGARLGTSIHAGTFRFSLRPSSVMGVNVVASMALSLLSAVLLAMMAKATALIFGVSNSISLKSFIVISVIGGLVSSLLVLATAIALTSGSIRFGWDPDNVTAPMVTAMGDVVTVPALVWASGAVNDTFTSWATTAIAVLLSFALIYLIRRDFRSDLSLILMESLPVLSIGIVLDLIAGVTVERQLEAFSKLPVLLVMVPAFLAVAGAIGGTLSSRLSSKLHLGLIEARALPGALSRRELSGAFVLAGPIFVAVGVIGHLSGVVSSLASPGIWALLATVLIGGALATILATAIAYYSTILSVRMGFDPDTYSIPLVTSTMDLFGAFTFIFAVVLLGYI